MSEAHSPPPVLYELLASTAAALLAGYVRGRLSPRPWSFPAIVSRVCEAVVCGFIAAGVSGWLGTEDPRVTVGVSAALGLLGTGALAELLTSWVRARTGKN